jgi:hypothetical protein
VTIGNVPHEEITVCCEYNCRKPLGDKTNEQKYRQMSIVLIVALGWAQQYNKNNQHEF